MKSLGASKGEIMAKRTFFAIVCVVLSVHATAWGQGPGYALQGPYGPPAGPWAGGPGGMRPASMPAAYPVGTDASRARCSRDRCNRAPHRSRRAMGREIRVVAATKAFRPGSPLAISFICGRGMRTWPTASSSTVRLDTPPTAATPIQVAAAGRCQHRFPPGLARRLCQGAG